MISTKLVAVQELDNEQIRRTNSETAERRREHRYPTTDPAEVEVLSGPGTKIAALVMDVSRSGVRVWLPTRLKTDTEVNVWLRSHTIIVGVVRYCHANEVGFNAGILIRSVISSAPHSHIHDDDLSLYLVGKGLTLMEVARIKTHLTGCDICRGRLADTNAALFALRKTSVD